MRYCAREVGGYVFFGEDSASEFGLTDILPRKLVYHTMKGRRSRKKMEDRWSKFPRLFTRPTHDHFLFPRGHVMNRFADVCVSVSFGRGSVLQSAVVPTSSRPSLQGSLQRRREALRFNGST